MSIDLEEKVTALLLIMLLIAVVGLVLGTGYAAATGQLTRGTRVTISYPRQECPR